MSSIRIYYFMNYMKKNLKILKIDFFKTKYTTNNLFTDYMIGVLNLLKKLKL